LTATKILWGQILVFAIVLATVWVATQWTAWQLGFQPQLGSPWFEAAGVPVYVPPAFFWWWFHHDAYAPPILVEGASIAASGGFASIGFAICMSVWREREARIVTTYGSARWATTNEVRSARLLDTDGVALGRVAGDYLRHDGLEHVLCFAPTRSGKGVGLVIPTLLARRLDRMTRQVEPLARDLPISVEALALFIRFWLTTTPPLPDSAQTAALAKGRERRHRSEAKALPLPLRSRWHSTRARHASARKQVSHGEAAHRDQVSAARRSLQISNCKQGG